MSVCRGNISLKSMEGSGAREGKLVQCQWLKRRALGLFLWLGSPWADEMEDPWSIYIKTSQKVWL